MTKDDLDFMFCYWLPWESEILEPIYQQARDMAQAIVDNTKPGKERSAALMNLLLSVKHTTKAVLKERAIAHE